MNNYMVTVKTNRGNITTSTTAMDRYKAKRKIADHYNVRIKDVVSCKLCK